MLFSDSSFFLFFIIYFSLFIFLPRRFQFALLLIGSIIFYGYWNPYYVWLPLILTLIAFWGTAWLDKESAFSRSNRLKIIIATILLPLFFFKYTNFFFGLLFHTEGKILHYSLPLGVSFITFTLLSYTIDVYRGKYPAEMRANNLFGSVLFFPHLIAGPIVRPIQLIPQLKRNFSNSKKISVYGILLFSVGLFKKLVIADSLSPFVEKIYQKGSGASFIEALLVFYAFAVQIYCDFSGYTDMALGIARILNIRLPQNFNRPYCADSIIDFWKRWHISLSTWLRDYLYIPLGGGRKDKFNRTRNLFITMILGGLWHGASFNFIIWGFLHALAISINHFIRNFQFSIPSSIKKIFVFHWVCIAWVFFRAPNLKQASALYSSLFSFSNFEYSQEYNFTVILLVFFFASHFLDFHGYIRWANNKLPRYLILVSIALLWIISLAVSSGNSGQFIYFEF